LLLSFKKEESSFLKKKSKRLLFSCRSGRKRAAHAQVVRRRRPISQFDTEAAHVVNWERWV
jgi:hypothetical protein